MALAVCVAGTLWRMGRWFYVAIGPEADSATSGRRMTALLKALPGILFSRKLWAVGRAMILDVLLQRQIARQNITRWIMHMGLFYGIVLLILTHALDDLTLAWLVTDYASTINPFMLLRNLLGLLMFIGLVIAIIRRHKIGLLKRFNSSADRLTIVLLVAILFSGIALEATQIVSSSIFDEMVVDYWGSDDTDEIAPLKAYWTDRFEVVFETPPAMDASVLEAGGQLHEDYCAACHSRPRSAFMAFPLARAIKPIATWLDGIRFDIGLWYFHYLVSCLALAYLPFGKLFHLVSVPVSLAIRAVGPAQTDAPENRPARRAMGLDACTHCGVCSRHCNVAPIMAVIDNPTILPSEKIGAVGRMARGRISPARHWQLARGSAICTNCGRCSDLCPSGIDLQDMWQASEADLARHGYQPPHGWIRNKTVVQWADLAAAPAAQKQPIYISDAGPRLTENPGTFWACVQCTTCTNVCPVVAASDNPGKDLDMTPQQVMNLMRLELKEMALGCRMVWDCVTCYKCQEHCPQGVPVADVLYELRNEACRRLTPDSRPISTQAGSRPEEV
jgi:heterodisulfide reductase subunit C/nitrate reductase gamma subunit